MTLAGDINETGHLDDGIFPAFYMCQLSPVPACLPAYLTACLPALLPACFPACLPDWVTGRLAGCLPSWLLLLVQLWPSDDTGICHDELKTVNRLMADGRAAAGTVAHKGLDSPKRFTNPLLGSMSLILN